MRLKDKVAIVTGAGSSIGQESAILFANEGARVIVAEINEQAGQETAERIGKNALFVRIDVSSWDDTQRMVKSAVECTVACSPTVHSTLAFLLLCHVRRARLTSIDLSSLVRVS